MQILGFEKGSIRQTDKVEKPRVFPPEIRAVGIQGRGLSIALQTRPSLVWESVCGKDLDSSPVLVCLTAQVPHSPSQDGTRMTEKLSLAVGTVGLCSQVHSFLRVTERLVTTYLCRMGNPKMT